MLVFDSFLRMDCSLVSSLGLETQALYLVAKLYEKGSCAKVLSGGAVRGSVWIAMIAERCHEGSFE